MYTNIDGFLNKRSEFLTVVNGGNMIIALTETKAKNQAEVLV